MIRRVFGRARGVVRRAGVVAAVLALGGPTGGLAQQPPALESASSLLPAAAAAGLDAVKTAIDEIEKTFNTGAQSEEGLVALKRRLAPLRDQLHDRSAQLDPRLKQIDQRVAQLGPSPDSSEDAAITAERLRLAGQRSAIEGTLKQAKLLDDPRRRSRPSASTNAVASCSPTCKLVVARGASLFDAAFWNDLAEAVPAELAGLYGLLSLWATHARSNGGLGGAVAGVVILMGLGGLAWFVARWRRRLTAVPTPRRFDKALVAMIILGSSTVMTPVWIAAAVLVLRNFGLMPYPVIDIGFGLAAAAAVVGFGRGVAVALFAPGAPARRIIAFDDREAESYASHLIWSARVFGVAVFLNAVHRALGSPVAPIIATGEVLAFAILAAITIHLLWRSTHDDSGAARDGAAGVRLTWLRGILWVAGIAISRRRSPPAMWGLRCFLAGRLLAALAIGGAVTIGMIVFIDALLTELPVRRHARRPQRSRRRSASRRAASISPRRSPRRRCGWCSLCSPRCCC